MIAIDMAPEEFRHNITHALAIALHRGDQVAVNICRRFLSTFLCHCKLSHRIRIMVSV